MSNKQLHAGANRLICQPWQWKERGWDSEDDGFSLHITMRALQEFIKEYWDGMPDVVPAPSEYSCPSGAPYLVMVDDAVRFEVSLTGSKRYYTSFSYPDVHPDFEYSDDETL